MSDDQANSELDATSIYEEHDWEAYTHRALYGMVNEDVSPSAAEEVAELWSVLCAELQEIGTDLRIIGEATAQAWEGQAADLARGFILDLSGWSTDTGMLAGEARDCVSTQAGYVELARAEMPPPVVMGRDRTPPTADTAGGDGMATAANSFSGGGFDSAGLMIADHGAIADEARAAHQQAAETLQRFQRRSSAVYATVPQFTPPKPLPAGNGGVEPLPSPQPGSPGGNTPSGGAATGGAPVRGEPAAGMAGDPDQSGAQRPGGRTAATPGQPGPGYGAEAAAANARSATGAGGRPAGGMMGGMPMGAPTARDGGDIEHRVAPYLQEDDDIWGGLPAVAPPVIGE